MSDTQSRGATSSPRRTLSPLWMAIWAGADKALSVLYGVAVVGGVLRALGNQEWASWSVFQTFFLSISLLTEFFFLQPMVKISSEHDVDMHPVITGASLLYSGTSLFLAMIVVICAVPLERLLKTPGSSVAFIGMGWMMASTVVRNIAIRILQISYRIVAIFLVDFAYFAILIGMIAYGTYNHSLKNASDLITYNLIGFVVSSFVGVVFTFRDIVPTFHSLGPAIRRIWAIGIHQGGTGALTVAQQQSDVIIVGSVRGASAVAVYNAARTFYRVFEQLRDAGQLLLVPATSRAFSQERVEAVQEVTELATAALLAVLVPITIVLVVGAPFIVHILLPKYPEAVPVFQWLMANGFCMPFVIVPSAVLLGIGQTRELFRGTLFGTIILVASGLVLTWFFGEVGMAIGVFCGTAATAILLTQRMNRYVHFTLRSVIRRSRSFGPLVKERLKKFGFVRGEEK